MKKRLSLLMISNKTDKLHEKSLKSVSTLVDEIIIIKDNYYDLGKKRSQALKKVTGEWALVLDDDEIISDELNREIDSLLHGLIDKYSGYFVRFQNHFLGRPVNYGGENYRMLRLFKKKAVKIKPAFVHEHFEINGKTGELKNKILHYSYRSLPQMFRKFTDYAVREAKQKSRKGEKTSLKKIFLYPAHMFWARFVKDRGYKDGIFRIPLDLGFAYMELLTYVLLLFYSWRKSKIKD